MTTCIVRPVLTLASALVLAASAHAQAPQGVMTPNPALGSDAPKVTRPLTPTKAITNDDLVSASGSCAGMAEGPANANALADNAAGAPPGAGGGVALGHTECDVVRGLGAPDNVDLSSNPRGDRVAVLTYSRGARAGIYTFTSGRLSSVEAGPEPQPAKPKAKKK